MEQWLLEMQNDNEMCPSCEGEDVGEIAGQVGGRQEGGVEVGGGERSEEGEGDGEGEAEGEEDPEGERLNGVSPRRAALRRAALHKLVEQAERMKRRVGSAEGKLHLTVGDVVRIQKPAVDRGKLDATSLVCVIVDVVLKGRLGTTRKYRLSTAAGPLQPWWCRHDLHLLRHMTAPLAGLADALERYRAALENGETPVMLSVRTAAQRTSICGGQGMARCSCRGDCLSNRCSCFRAGHICGSRCHPRNAGLKCCNRDEDPGL